MTLKKFIAVLFLLVILSSPAVAADAPKSMRGIKWGTPLSALKDMVYNDSIGDRLKLYTRRNDNMHVGNVELGAVFYNFLDGKFSGLIMLLEKVYKDDIVLMLRQRYGEPDNAEGDVYVWRFGSIWENYPFSITAEPMEIEGQQIFRVRYFTSEELQYMIEMMQAGADEL